MVEEDKNSVHRAAILLDIKFGTAKSIIRSYRKRGKIL